MTMPTPQSSPLSFWKTVRLLLSVARRRAIGRGKRQLSLLNQRTEKTSSLDTWGWLGFVAMTLAMALLHAGAAFIIGGAVNTGQQLEVEKHGKIVVGRQLTMALQFADSLPPGEQELARQLLEKGYAQEARRRSRRYGGPAETHERLLRDAVASNRSGDFVDITTATPGIKTLATSGAMPALLGSLLLGLWFVMMVCQGEGLELDVQRRRHQCRVRHADAAVEQERLLREAAGNAEQVLDRRLHDLGQALGGDVHAHAFTSRS